MTLPRHRSIRLVWRSSSYPRRLRCRTPFDATYSFQARLGTNIPTPLTPLPPTRTTLHWPGSLNVGLAVKPSDTFLLAADWARTDWSKMIFDAPDGTHVNFFDLAPADSTLAGQSDDWRIGAEYLLFVGNAVLPLRVGWSYEPQPVKDAVTGDRIVREGWSFGAVDGKPFIAMELLTGETLEKVLRREKRLSPRHALEAARGIALALDYAHMKGIVHRDLKPDNIMILTDGTVKVMDYGIARQADLTALTGTLPFTGTHSLEVIQKHVNDPLPPFPPSRSFPPSSSASSSS